MKSFTSMHGYHVELALRFEMKNSMVNRSGSRNHKEVE